MTPQFPVDALLTWFRANARVLPWREHRTPYRVWLSEIMLQQTRVEAVIPYFERFLAALPDIRALAEADEELLLKLWEGLGYYSRVRNLQKAAKIIATQHGGEFPSGFSGIRALPGIGDYTAGAIASIAFEQPVPVRRRQCSARPLPFSGEPSGYHETENPADVHGTAPPDLSGRSLWRFHGIADGTRRNGLSSERRTALLSLPACLRMSRTPERNQERTSGKSGKEAAPHRKANRSSDSS